MEHLDLAPASHASGSVRLPGSKSISNRFLLLAALAEGETAIRDLLLSDDVERMLEALKALGIDWQRGGEGNDCGRARRRRRLPGRSRPSCSWAMPARPSVR